MTRHHKFTAKERDTESGNDDFGARYYSNRFGRWLSSDWSAVPVAVPCANLTNPQTLNLYSMVADDPESFADLDGHYMNVLASESGFGDPTFLGTLSGSVSDPAEPQAPQQQAQKPNVTVTTTTYTATDTPSLEAHGFND